MKSKMNLYDLIKDGCDGKIIIQDERSYHKITLRLLNLMVCAMPSVDKFIFPDDYKFKADLLDIFQENCRDLNLFLPEKLSEYKIIGRSIEFSDGLSKDYYNENCKYVDYLVNALKVTRVPNICSLILGVNSSYNTCVLGFC